tara:strand:- start:273 stop:455 length:183 start_codon:yes stop_codon:yes gene_type:complete
MAFASNNSTSGDTQACKQSFYKNSSALDNLDIDDRTARRYAQRQAAKSTRRLTREQKGFG